MQNNHNEEKANSVTGIFFLFRTILVYGNMDLSNEALYTF